jgi:hypothetical protein
MGLETTFGAIADKNAKKMGKELVQKKTEEIRSLGGKVKPNEKPFWQQGEKPLNLNEVKDVNRYIKYGLKS